MPVSPHDGQQFTYLDSKGNVVTVTYNKVLDTWVQPAVTVKGTPPANPTVKTYHYYQDPATQKNEIYALRLDRHSLGNSGGQGYALGQRYGNSSR